MVGVISLLTCTHLRKRCTNYATNIEVLTPEERRYAMGNSGDVYERYYMLLFIDADCQAIYLRTTRHEDLIRAIGRLERHDDALNKLTKA